MKPRPVPETFAILAIDPGKITGVAYGEMMAMPTVGDTLREAAGAGLIESWEVEGIPELQGWELAAEAADRLADWNLRGGPICDFSIVIERFQLRQARADLSPVEVSVAFRTLLIPRGEMVCTTGWSGTYLGGVGLYEQEPSTAMTYATSARLKQWGLFALGRSSRDHRRDALRHLATRTAAVLEGTAAA